MSATEPPKLPETLYPVEKPVWLWALLIAGVFGMVQFTQAELGKGSGYRAGYAVATASAPLLAAWFATAISKKSYVPTIAAGAVVAVLLTTGNTTRRTIDRVTQNYIVAMEDRIGAWSESGKAWQGCGGCDSAVIQNQEQLQRNLKLALEMMESTRKLLADLESGNLLLTTLRDAGVSNTDSSAAWSHLQADEEYVMLLDVMRATDELLDAAGIYLSELDHKFGRWHVDADSDSLLFDDDVSDIVIKRVKDAADDMQRCNDRVAKAAASQRN